MSGRASMRKVWMGVAFGFAALSFYPAWTGATSWLLPGIAFVVFVVFLAEPWFLTWELRRRGEELQISDDGVLRKLARGDSEYVRWDELREVSLVVAQDANPSPVYFYLLAGAGTNGVLVGPDLAARHDLLSHLAKLPGFDHRGIEQAMSSPVNRRFTLWRAAPLEGEAKVIPIERALERDRQRLH